jgi:hypothetical protein
MANDTSEEIYTFAGSNLQICFVNEHHQANESSDSDGVRKIFTLKKNEFVCKDSSNFKNKI